MKLLLFPALFRSIPIESKRRCVRAKLGMARSRPERPKIRSQSLPPLLQRRGRIDDQTGKMASCTCVRRRDHGHMQNIPIYHGCSRHSSDPSRDQSLPRQVFTPPLVTLWIADNLTNSLLVQVPGHEMIRRTTEQSQKHYAGIYSSVQAQETRDCKGTKTEEPQQIPA